MHEYMAIHEKADSILRLFNTDSSSLSRSQILPLLGRTKTEPDDINAELNLLVVDGYLIRHDGNMFEISGMGRIFINKGGYQKSLEIEKEKEIKRIEIENLQINTNKSVIDTNDSVKTTNQSVAKLNSLLGDNIGKQHNLARNAVIIAGISALVSIVSLLKDCNSDNKTLKLDPKSLQPLLDTLRIRQNPDTILRTIHDTLYLKNSDVKKSS